MNARQKLQLAAEFGLFLSTSLVLGQYLRRIPGRLEKEYTEFPAMADLQTRALTAIQNGKVFTDDIRAKQRLANVNQLLTEVFAACGELGELSVTSTAAETFGSRRERVT